MKNIAAFIISYLPDDDRREIRLKTVTEQITEWLEYSTMNIHVLSMNYTDADIASMPSDKRLNLIRHSSLKTGPAHVVIQGIFYDSDYKWGVMMDDDACLYHGPQHNSAYNMFEEMDSHIEDYKAIGSFYPVNPMHEGFNPYYKRQPKYETHHIFTRLTSPKGTMYGLRNFKRYGETPIFSSVDVNLDDVDFEIQMINNGYPSYTCANMVLREIAHNASFFGGENNSDTSYRLEQSRLCVKMLMEKYPGLIARPSGKSVDLPQYRRFKRLVWNKEIQIPKNGEQDDSLFDWGAV